MKNRTRNERRRARREAVRAVVFTACIILYCGLPNWLEVWLCAI